MSRVDMLHAKYLSETFNWLQTDRKKCSVSVIDLFMSALS